MSTEGQASRATVMKTMSLRLEESMAREAALVAAVEERTVSELVREGLAHIISTYRRDEDFRRRLRQKQEEERDLVARFVEGRGQ